MGFRKAAAGDRGEIMRLNRRCFNRHDLFKPGQLKRFIENPSGSIIADVILSGGKTAGWAVFFTRKNSRKVRLYALCLGPEYRGRGLAEGYLKKRLAVMSGDGFDEALLEVRPGNGRARRLYARLGFKERKRFKGYYSDGEDGIRMVLSLKQERLWTRKNPRLDR